MAYLKLQTSTALNIVTSDDANIPFPNVVASGTSDTVTANQLNDTTGTFVTSNVQTGDVVVNLTTNQSATVVRVIDEDNLVLNANIFLASADDFVIYANNRKEGCVLYIGAGGTLRVITAGGQDVTFYGILGGSFLPVNVLKVFQTGTSASELVALW
jgi:hypothetical protein